MSFVTACVIQCYILLWFRTETVGHLWKPVHGFRNIIMYSLHLFEGLNCEFGYNLLHVYKTTHIKNEKKKDLHL